MAKQARSRNKIVIWLELKQNCLLTLFNGALFGRQKTKKIKRELKSLKLAGFLGYFFYNSAILDQF